MTAAALLVPLVFTATFPSLPVTMTQLMDARATLQGYLSSVGCVKAEFQLWRVPGDPTVTMMARCVAWQHGSRPAL